MYSLLKEPSGREQKPGFYDVPAEVVLKLQEACSGRIVSAETAYGGFSASASFVITLADERKFFVKGTHPLDTSHGAENLRQEILAYGTLPALDVLSPKYIGVVSDGTDDDGWMLGVWEYVEHRTEFLSADVAVSVLRNWPVDSGAGYALIPSSSHVFIGRIFDNEKKWTRIRSNEDVRKKFLSIFSDPKAGAWLEKSISALCSLQERGERLAEPEGILHGDLRLDNILFTTNGPRVIDWPNICFGPRVFDVSFLYSSLEAFGVCDFDEALKSFDAGVKVGDFAVMLGCLSGYFADQAYREAPVIMPRLRWMQRSMLLAQLNQLSRMGIIESPPRMHGELQP